MTLIVLLLAVWIAGCLLIAGLLWALAGARLFAQTGGGSSAGCATRAPHAPSV
jgi:hypothetical protein